MNLYGTLFIAVAVEEAQDNNAEETIENIENFLESEKSSENKAPRKPKEEWVTVIFGEDGKEITNKSGRNNEKSVYDLDDEDFSTTKATPFAGNRGKIEPFFSFLGQIFKVIEEFFAKMSNKIKVYFS